MKTATLLIALLVAGFFTACGTDLGNPKQNESGTLAESVSGTKEYGLQITVNMPDNIVSGEPIDVDLKLTNVGTMSIDISDLNTCVKNVDTGDQECHLALMTELAEGETEVFMLTFNILNQGFHYLKVFGEAVPELGEDQSFSEQAAVDVLH